jgi:hypothetical protein
VPCFARLRLDFLVPHLDLTVDHEGWEAADEVGATALSTVHEGVLCALLLEVILLLGAPRARVRSVHSHTWATRGLVLLWRHKLIFSLLGHAGVWHVCALGAQPPLVDVKCEHTDDQSECDTHNDGITIHLYCTLGKKKSGRWRAHSFTIRCYFSDSSTQLQWIFFFIIHIDE